MPTGTRKLKRLVEHIVVIHFEGKICMWCTHCYAADDVPSLDPESKQVSKDFHKKHARCEKAEHKNYGT